MKSIHNKFLKDKLARYQNDELGKQEREVIDKWFDDHLSTATTEFPKDPLATEQLRRELLAGLKVKEVKYKLPYTWIGVACSILIMASILFLHQYKVSNDNQVAEATGQTFHTANGKMQKITLSDGTEIWMNAGTTIRVASGFSSAKFRKVYLEKGEAFFKVKRDTLRPFSIATKHMLTTVLGTSFNIKAYPDAQVYQVAVSTGKVKVAQQADRHWNVLSSGLVKGEVLTYHTLSGKTEIGARNANLISSWRTNRSIYADGLTLSQISDEISRQYAIEVRLGPGGNQNRKYHLTLPHRPLRMVLQQLAVATGINYQLTNSQVIINPAIQ